jgi:hypothetical protein
MDRMNNDFFRPRGLYCLLMAYSPIATDKKAKVNDANAVSKNEPPLTGSNFPATVRRNFRDPLAGTAQGEESLPDTVATLVYPDVSGERRSPGKEQKKRKPFTRLNDYFDRRAQARYVRLIFISSRVLLNTVHKYQLTITHTCRRLKVRETSSQLLYRDLSSIST